nr:hypothetical protein [Tanacetum cinerariifolium]
MTPTCARHQHGISFYVEKGPEQDMEVSSSQKSIQYPLSDVPQLKFLVKFQYKFPLPVKVVATARRLEMSLPEDCTAIEEKKKKLPVKDRWQLH